MEKENQIKIIGYFAHKEDEKDPSTIFVAIDEIWDLEGNITAYAPIGQHSALSKEILKECTEITKEEYIRLSDDYYTPEEYL